MHYPIDPRSTVWYHFPTDCQFSLKSLIHFWTNFTKMFCLEDRAIFALNREKVDFHKRPGGGTRSYEGHKLGERVFQFTWRTLKAKCKWKRVRKKHSFLLPSHYKYLNFESIHFFAFCIWLKYRKLVLSKSFKNIYRIIGPTQWNFPHVAKANPWSKLPLKISIFFEPFAWHQSKMKVHLSWVIFLQIHEDSVEVGVI